MAGDTGKKAKDHRESSSGEEREEFILRPPEEEVERLRKMKVPELINEFFSARQRLKIFMEEHGIVVPELSFNMAEKKGQLDVGSAHFVDSFTREAIRSIDPEVEAVSSSVKSFVILFDSLISTNAFEDVMVTVEGADEPFTVKQLLEGYDSNRFGEECKVVIGVHDLRQQLDALIDDTSSGTKSFEGVDDDDIAATRETGRDGGDKVFSSALGEGMYSFSSFSPYITQEMFNGLFRQKGEDLDAAPPAESTDSWGAAAAGGGKNDDSGTVFDDNAEIPVEAADIFDDFIDEEEAEKVLEQVHTHKVASEGSSGGDDASADDIDAMFAESEPGNDEVPGDQPDVEPETMADDDIDRLFAAESETGDESPDDSLPKK